MHADENLHQNHLNYLRQKIFSLADRGKFTFGCVVRNTRSFPPTTCSLNKQQRKSYRGIAETDADSVEKFRISKAYEINANPGKDMSTQILKKNLLQNVKK